MLILLTVKQKIINVMWFCKGTKDTKSNFSLKAALACFVISKVISPEKMFSHSNFHCFFTFFFCFSFFFFLNTYLFAISTHPPQLSLITQRFWLILILDALYLMPWPLDNVICSELLLCVTATAFWKHFPFKAALEQVTRQTRGRFGFCGSSEACPPPAAGPVKCAGLRLCWHTSCHLTLLETRGPCRLFQ